MTAYQKDALIVVQSANPSTRPSLHEYALTGVKRITSKYFKQLNAATVYFRREGRTYRCTASLDVGTLQIVTSGASGHRRIEALDGALRKAGKQLRRLKRVMREDKLPRSARLIHERTRRTAFSDDVFLGRWNRRPSIVARPGLSGSDRDFGGSVDAMTPK